MPMTPAQRMRDLLRRYDSFVTALESQLAYDITRVERLGCSAETIAELEAGAGMKVPEDLQTFWMSDVNDISIVIELGQLAMCDPLFLSPMQSLEIAQQANVRGIPFRGGEHFCYVGEDGSVWQHGTNEPIARSFVDWFELWLASGCWSAGADQSLFTMHWKMVAPLVPVRRLPENNAWLVHLGRVEHAEFPGRYGRVTGPAVWERA